MNNRTFGIINEFVRLAGLMIPNISLLIRKVAPIDFTSFANNPQPVSYHQPIFLVLVFASFYKVVVVCLSMICDKMYSFPVVDNPPSPT